MSVVAKEFVGGIKTDSILKLNGQSFPMGVTVVNVATVPNANYTMGIDDYLITMNTATTNKIITLISAIGNSGKTAIFKNTGVKSLILTPVLGQLIEGTTSFILQKGFSAMIVSDGTGWVVV